MKDQESFGVCSTYTYNTDAFILQYMVWVKLSDSPTLTELAFGELPLLGQALARMAKMPRADFTEEEVSPSVESCNHVYDDNLPHSCSEQICTYQSFK